jgi:ABC-type sugar transport system substrate-binding protein
MKRREALSRLVGLGAAALAPSANSQAPRRIAVVQYATGSFRRNNWAGKGLLAAMAKLGCDDGRDFMYDFRGWRRSGEIPAIMQRLLRR